MEQLTSNDEISLRDIIAILVKRSWIIFTTILICLALVIIMIFTTKESVQFSQGIIPANYFVDGKINFLELPTDLISRVQSIYIPQFVNNYNDQHPKHPISVERNRIEFIIPKETYNVFYLTARIQGTNAAILFKQLSVDVLANINTSQAELINIERQQLQQKIMIMSAQLPKYEKLDLVMQASLKKAVSLADQTDKSNGSLSLSDYLAYGMMQNKEQDMLNLQLQLSALQQQLQTFKPTAFFDEAVYSPVPEPSNIIKVILALIMGLILGILLVFTIEAWQRVNK